MKKAVLLQTLLVAAIGFMCIFFVNIGNAAAIDVKHAGVEASGDATRNITIPPLPNGEVLNVWIWNDCKESDGKAIGKVSNFTLKDPCDSFNFIWKDSGGTHWHKITPRTKPGGELQSVYHPDGYKYGYKEADVNR